MFAVSGQPTGAKVEVGAFIQKSLYVHMHFWYFTQISNFVDFVGVCIFSEKKKGKIFSGQ